ncbi:hypothetical protein, partial [Pseudomonas syringae]|uniref:hypothetical protein n=1 Tax=Pseudomonas syringae TaxID=317 RepID=UPI001F2CE2E0
AWRPARLPPDQCQDSAVTYVALCVVSDIVIKKRFLLTMVPTLRVDTQFLTLCVTQWFCDVSNVCLRLDAPFRPSASYFDGAKV